MSEPAISAIICSFNRHAVLSAAIASLRAQTIHPQNFEILVIDNSADQSKAQTFGANYQNIPGLSYICQPLTGLSQARNVGLEYASGRIAAFLDDDAVADPGWAQALLDGMSHFPNRAGAIGGPVKPIWPHARPPWLADNLLIFLGIIDWGPELHEIMPGRGLIGCNMAVERALARSLGGFSTHLGRHGSDLTLLSNEESQLLESIQCHGHAVLYAPLAIVHHHIQPSRLEQNWFLRRAAWQAVSDYLMEPQKCYETTARASTQFKPVHKPAPLPQNAAAFTGQFWVTYHATLTALAGGDLPLQPSSSWTRQYQASRMKNTAFGLTQMVPGLAHAARAGLKTYQKMIKN